MKLSNTLLCSTTVRVAARISPLSQVQVREVEKELQKTHPHVVFEPTWTQTTGDLDQKTSLRELDKTDFFTKEIDSLVLQGGCDVGVHSAKDLPEPLPKGLVLIALTRGINNADVLVLREGETLTKGARIGSSSKRREEAVLQLLDTASFVDIRGTIGQRLEQLNRREVDGVVIAEAALIRLGLTHLNRIVLPGRTAPFQGQLAVIAKKEHTFLQRLFNCIDSR